MKDSENNYSKEVAIKKDFSVMEIEMTDKNIKAKGEMSPWIRFCIGMGILFLTVTPLILAIRWW